MELTDQVNVWRDFIKSRKKLAHQLDCGGVEYNLYRDVLCDTLELADHRYHELLTLLESQSNVSEQRKQSLQIFERFFAESPVAYLIVTEYGEVLRVNQKARYHWGLTPSSLTNLQIGDLIDSVSIGKLHQAFESTARGIKKASVEIYCKRIAGSGFWGRFEIFRIQGDQAGNLLLCAVRDVSVKRASELALQKTAIGLSAGTGLEFFTRLLHYLLSHESVDGAIVTSVCADGSFESLAIASQLPCGNSFRYDRPEILNQSRLRLAVKLHEPSESFIQPFLRHFNAHDGLSLFLFDAKRTVFGELAIVGKGPLKDKKLLSSILKIVSVRACSELERLKIEKKLTDHQEHLEELVRLRTHDLEKKSEDLEIKNQQLFAEIKRREQIENILQDAIKKAEEANLAKSAFLANMSHEIRTPLNGIIGLTSLVAKSDLSAKDRKYVDLILESGQCLLRIVNDILEFSKLESGQLKTETVNFNLRDVISNCFLAFEPMIRAKDLYFTVDYPYDIPDCIVSDPGRVRQILDNLVSNAIKFTETGGVVIKVRCNTRAGTLEISVKDTGIGLSELQKEHIFERFYQADTSTTRKIRGTGLGLAISQKISLLLKGNISFDSRLNVGSDFILSLPSSVLVDKDSRHQVTYCQGKNEVFLVGLAEDLSQSFASMVSSLGLECREVPHDYFEQQGPVNCLVEKYSKAKSGPLIFVSEDHALWDCPEELARKARVFTIGNYDPKITDFFPQTSHLSKTILLDRLLMEHGIIDIRKQEVDTLAAHTENAINQDLKLLIVEDNPINCEVLAGMMESLGLHIDIAHDGLEALEAHDRKDYDVILMDCLMPQMDGFTAVKNIRSGAKPDVYVVALTANALPGDREECLNAGFDEYLSKPIKVEDVVRVLSSFKKSQLRTSSISQWIKVEKALEIDRTF